MIKISSANAGYLSKIKQKNQNNKTIKQSQQTLPDNLKKPVDYKKIVLGAGILAGVVLLAIKTKPLIGIKGKIILKNAEKLKKEASSALEEGKKQFDEVAHILFEGKKNNFQDIKDESGNVIRRYVTCGNWDLMQEFNGEKITKEVEFDPKNLHFEGILNNVEYLDDGSKIAGKTYLYSPNGALESYIEKYTITAKGNEQSKNMFVYQADKILVHSDSCITNFSDGIDSKKTTWFDTNGKVISYSKRNVRTFDGEEYMEDSFKFDENGKITEYIK